MVRWELLVTAGLVMLAGAGCSSATAAVKDVAATLEGQGTSNVYTQTSPPGAVQAPTSAEPAERPFDEAEARAKLAQVNVAPCSGGHREEARARIYYRADGVLAALVIDESTAVEPERVRCVGQKLGRVTVPPFRGGPAAFGMYLQL